MLKIAHDILYKHPLKENHRFPKIKYELIQEQISMGDRYSPIIKDIIEVHANTFSLAQEIYF